MYITFFYVIKTDQTRLVCAMGVCRAAFAKLFKDFQIRTHDLMSIGRALYQLRQSSFF